MRWKVMFKADMWYGDQISDVDRIDISFSDIDCVYRGNLYRNKKCIGDYVCDDSVELEKSFPQLTFKWE